MSQLYDFEVAILGSVLPYIYFKNYVVNDRQRKLNYFGYLKLVTTYQQYLSFERLIRMKDYQSEEEKEFYEAERA
jgi:hypothetical protein